MGRIRRRPCLETLNGKAMWIYLTDSFLSIIESQDDPGVLLVRARHEGDIERVFPGAEVERTPHRDYLYRALVSRTDVAKALTEQVNRIGYRNFKDCVKAESRPEAESRHDAYTHCWRSMVAWQHQTEGAARK